MFVAKIAAAAAFLATAMAQSGMVNTPASLQQCQPASISWTVTKAPFFLSVIPGGQASAAALVDFGSQTASPYVWTPALAVGTSVTIKLIDGDGNPYYSSPVTIQAGSSTACLNSTAGAATTGATSRSASAAVSSAAGSATAAVSSAASSAAGVVSSVRSSAASAASSAASAASSAASAAASSVTGARTSGASTSAAASAAASSGAATKMEITGFGAVILGAIGAIVAL